MAVLSAQVTLAPKATRPAPGPPSRSFAAQRHSYTDIPAPRLAWCTPRPTLPRCAMASTTACATSAGFTNDVAALSK